MVKRTKFIALILALCFLLGAFSGCGATKDADTANKLVIDVGVFNGGYGYKWLENAAKLFEEEYKDYKSGDKTGVKIRINPDRYTGSNVMDNIKVTDNDMYFTEQVSNWYDFIKADYLLEITDVVATDTNPYGQGHSIVSSLKEGLADMYGVKGDDGELHYYTLPYATAFTGFIFDAELFYNKGLFLTKEYDEKGNEGAVDDYVIEKIEALPSGVDDYATLVTENGKNYYKTCKGDYLSMGPDGKYGTDDDGQARTYKEFFNLCDYMINNANVYPFVYGGKASYIRWLLGEMITDYSGYEQTKLNFTFDGTLTDLISVSSTGVVTELPDVELVPDNSNNNAINITKTKARYEALNFLQKMMQGNRKYMHPDAKATYDQYRGQESFMLSNREYEKGAYLIDGCWWENEADVAGTFNELEKAYGSEYNKHNRMFKFAALPKASLEKVGEERTIVDQCYQMAFIFKSIAEEKKDIAKKFLQFCFTDKMNIQYTLDTSLVRPYNYELNKEQESQITSFGMSLMSTLENSKIVYPLSTSSYYLKNVESLTVHAFLNTLIDGTKYENIVEVIYEKEISVATAFNGIYDYARSVGL